MSTKRKKATVRDTLHRLGLPNEDTLIRTILSSPAFLLARAEFRDDFLWHPSWYPAGLSAHVFLRSVTPCVCAELTYANGPSPHYILPSPIDAGASSSSSSSSKPDKQNYVESDHYVRFLLQVIPALCAEGAIFWGRVATEEDLRERVDEVGLLVHLLRNQYRPGNTGTLARWLQRSALPSRHVQRARMFGNARYEEMAAQGDLRGTGARAATIELEGGTEGERERGAGRRIASLGPATVLPGLSARGATFSPLPGPSTAPPSASLVGRPPGLASPGPRPPLPGSQQKQGEQEERSQHQHQHQHQQQQQKQQQHNRHQQAAQQHTLNKKQTHHQLELDRRPATPGASPAQPISIEAPCCRTKRSRSASSEPSLQDIPMAKVSKTDRSGVGGVVSGSGQSGKNRESGKALREQERLEQQPEDRELRDEMGVKKNEREDGLTLRQLITFEQVRLALRGYETAMAEADTRMLRAGCGDGMKLDDPEGSLNLWRKRCERNLRELRNVGCDGLDAAWKRFEEIKGN